MKRTLVRYRNTAFGRFVFRNQKYAPILFFMGGFIFDSLTLGRIDRVYDTVVLCSHMTLLSITLYLYNTVDEDKWEGTFIETLFRIFSASHTVLLWRTFKCFCHLFFQKCVHVKNYVFFHTAGSALICKRVS